MTNIAREMIIAFIFLMTILVILTYALLAPFLLEINSMNQVYGIRFHKVANARMLFVNESIWLDWRFLGWHKTIDLLSARPGKVIPSKKKKAHSTRFRISPARVIAILRSFKVNSCYASVDTGNMAANGILYPWALWLGTKMKGNLTINFCGRNEIAIEVENNFFRVLRAYAFTKSNYHP